MLLLDVGNTFTKWEFPANNAKGAFFTQDLLNNTLSLVNEHPQIRSITASWVGKSEAKLALEQSLQEKDVTLYLAKSEAARCGLQNGYREFERLGVDRWLAMLGLWNRNKRAFCVVDAGTALTMDFVDDQGNHLGGYIVPGVRTMISSLSTATAQIDCSLIKGSETDILPGRNTAEAVQRGVIITLAGSVDYAVKNIANRLALATFDCFIGGGDADILAPLLGSHWQVEESLVLWGLKTYLQNA